jgi:hypothetical protein
MTTMDVSAQSTHHPFPANNVSIDANSNVKSVSTEKKLENVHNDISYQAAVFTTPKTMYVIFFDVTYDFYCSSTGNITCTQ